MGKHKIYTVSLTAIIAPELLDHLLHGVKDPLGVADVFDVVNIEDAILPSCEVRPPDVDPDENGVLELQVPHLDQTEEIMVDGAQKSAMGLEGIFVGRS